MTAPVHSVSTAGTNPQITVCLELTRAVARARTLDQIYAAAFDALANGLGVTRAAIRLFDPDGVMRFKSTRGVSTTYQRSLEGASAWSADAFDPQPLSVSDVAGEPTLVPYREALAAEDICSMVCLPLVRLGRVIGKLTMYYDRPHVSDENELQLAGVIAAEIAFAVERARSEESARRSEERLRFALDSALMGTWEWDLTTQKLGWSDNLEAIHGLPPGTFDGTFESYRREIHPDDRERVLASIRRAVDEGVPHDVEYRIVGPDGTIRWVEGKGRVECEDGRPVRMAGICMMISRRKEAEIARLTSAEETSRLKDEFLATLSHELRTPLNAILGWVQMLESDQLPPEKRRHAIDVIGRNAKLQAQLIEDILDVSRIITGKLEIERRSLLVPQLVENVLSAALPTANSKRIRLLSDVPNGLPPIDGDPKRLQQVLGNIVSNAVKFTPELGQVSISCRHEGHSVAIAVRDTGVGVAADFLPFVFDRFRQADSRFSRMHGGLGLGLAIARHLVELHGGSIHAHSDGPGRGTTFEIRLPAESSQRQTTLIESVSTPPRLDGLTVLVVDDHADSGELLAELLGNVGAVVIQCPSAASTMGALTSMPIDLLIADLGMPDVDGYELIEKVRGMPGGCARVPAVAVSAYSRPEDRDKALATGYDGYCPKPVDAAALLRTVHMALGARTPEIT